MKDKELNDLIDEWENTWDRPGWGRLLKTVGWITLLLILLLITPYTCGRLNEKAKPDHQIEAIS